MITTTVVGALEQVVRDTAVAVSEARAEQRNLAALLVADSVACAAGATNAYTAGGASVVDLLTGIFSATTRTSPLLTPAVFGALAHWEEFDPLHAPSASLPSMWVAAVLGEALDHRYLWGGVLDAVNYGFEVSRHVASAVDATRLYEAGFLPSSVAGKLGATAALASVAGLTHDEVVRALSIAATLGPTVLASEITDAHYVAAGSQLMHAQWAVAMARSGASAPGLVLDGPPYNASIAGPSFGFPSSGAAQIFKRYPCARPLHSMIAGLRQVRDQAPEHLEAADRIILTLPTQVMGYVNNERHPAGPTQRRCSVSYVAHLALHDLAEELESYRHDRTIGREFDCVLRSGDPVIDSHYPQSWACRVTLESCGGEYTLLVLSDVRASSLEEHVPELKRKWQQLTGDSEWSDRLLGFPHDRSMAVDLLPSQLLRRSDQ